MSNHALNSGAGTPVWGQRSHPSTATSATNQRHGPEFFRTATAAIRRAGIQALSRGAAWGNLTAPPTVLAPCKHPSGAKLPKTYH